MNLNGWLRQGITPAAARFRGTEVIKDGRTEPEE